MTDLNGDWRGSGSDRNLPFESFQSTTCQTTIRADLRHMTSEMVCDGQSGLRKIVRLTATLDGDKLTGSVSQKTIVPGNPSASELNGSMSGRRVDDTASLLVRWRGMTPNTTVALKLRGPSSYSLHVSSLGITMMDVTFNRIARR